jgi:hypothetical protein
VSLDSKPPDRQTDWINESSDLPYSPQDELESKFTREHAEGAASSSRAL